VDSGSSPATTAALHISRFAFPLQQHCKTIYVHATVHLGNTSHINTNEMQLFSLLFGVTILHVSDAVCVHHQECYKL